MPPILPQRPVVIVAVGCGGQERQAAGSGAVDHREQRELFSGRRAAGVGRRRGGRGTRGGFGRLRGGGRGTTRAVAGEGGAAALQDLRDRKSTRLNSSHVKISYAVFCLKKKIGNICLAKRCVVSTTVY